MTRHIFIAAITLLATSCAIEDGSMERKPIDVGKAIAREAHQRLNNASKDICWALAADTYLTTDDDKVRDEIGSKIFLGRVTPHLTEDRDSVLFLWDDGQLSHSSYSIDGKLLSEGGVWKIWSDCELTLTAYDGVIEVRTEHNGETGANNSYKLDVSNWEYDSAVNFELSGTVEWVYNSDASKRLSVEIEDAIHYTSKQHRTHYSVYAVGLYNGVIKSIYTDSWAGHHDEVTMTYGEESDNSIVVSYLGDKSSIEIWR